jgi:transcriptional regulator GlxA family with amidase domain
MLKPALRNMVKDMPRIPGGGRPHSVPAAEEKQAMIEEVLVLMRSVSLGNAMKRVAIRHGISRRTIQRIWADRLRSQQDRKSV